MMQSAVRVKCDHPINNPSKVRHVAFFYLTQKLQIWICGAQVFFSTDLEHVSLDIHFLAGQGHRAGFVGLQQHAQRIKGQLKLRTDAEEQAADLMYERHIHHESIEVPGAGTVNNIQCCTVLSLSNF